MRRAGAAAAAAVAVLAGATSAPASVVVSVPAGAGTTLEVEDAPFALRMVGRDGRVAVASVPGTGGLPVRPPGLDGPLPLEPLGAAGADPALGWVLGARPGLTFPVSFFSGNRLLGAEAGAVVAVERVSGVRRVPHGADLDLATTAGVAAHAAIRTLPGGGVRLDVRPPAGLGVVSSLFALASPRGEGLYGLGARKDRFDQRGTLRNVWVEQQNLSDERLDGVGSLVEPDFTFPNGAQAAYFVQPLVVGSRGWAAWTGGTALARVDLAASRPEAVRWGVASPELRLTLAGGGVEDASRAFTADVGRAPAPPRWAFEPWIDVLNEGEGEAAPNGARFDGGPRVQRDLEEIARRARELDVPIGVLGVEGWHKVADGEGPQARAFFASLRRQGFRLSAYWNPFVAPQGRGHASAVQRDLLVRDPTGAPYRIVTNRGNVSHLVDFTAPGAATWWKEQLDRSADLGFEGFMEDFGEQVVEGMVVRDGAPPQLAHNAYPGAYHAAGRAAIDAQARERRGFEPWFYVRAGHTTTTAHTSGVFPGDESTDWSPASGLPSVVPAMLNLALGGGSAFTTDVGGYLDLLAPRTSPELLTRWSQLAAFTPVSRIHNSTGKGSLLPWDAGEAALDAYRRYAKAKVRLVRLVDRWSRRAARDGTIGPVRPLVLDDPSPAARSVDDQWLLGRDVLVAPVLRRGARTRRVHLPAGERWRRVRVGRAGELVPEGGWLDGGRTVEAAAPLADIPLFLREVGLRVARRCAGGRLRVALRGDVGSVLHVRWSVARRARRSAPFTVSTRRRVRTVRARAVLEDGRVLRLRGPGLRC